MRNLILLLTALFFTGLSFGQNWDSIKTAVSSVIELPLEYDLMYRQPLSTIGWEDGIHISDDGLNLYCTYLPIDFLSFILNEDLPGDFTSDYSRGAPTFGVDLTTNPFGADDWLHSDILVSHRNTVADSFITWSLSNMARSFYSEGAPTPSFTSNADSVEFMVFTSNDNATANTNIWVIENTEANPSGVGASISSTINTGFTEDNPHLVRINASKLVLFFDSDNLPGGLGDIDIWYSESNDNGTSWTVPANLSSLNSTDKEHQPFLHQDIRTGNWFLYHAAPHSDGKLAIFRSQQTTPNDWNSWGNAELVISAGNSAGIGEPTLTKNGDISFVVVYEDPEMNSIYDHFDPDPWFLQRRDTATGVSSVSEGSSISVYPNPITDKITIDSEKEIERIELFDSKGRLILVTDNQVINAHHLSRGIYFLRVHFESGDTENRKLVKQ